MRTFVLALNQLLQVLAIMMILVVLLLVEEVVDQLQHGWLRRFRGFLNSHLMKAHSSASHRLRVEAEAKILLKRVEVRPPYNLITPYH
jgi:hypothetical protein